MGGWTARTEEKTRIQADEQEHAACTHCACYTSFRFCEELRVFSSLPTIDPSAAVPKERMLDQHGELHACCESDALDRKPHMCCKYCS